MNLDSYYSAKFDSFVKCFMSVSGVNLAVVTTELVTIIYNGLCVVVFFLWPKV